MQERHNSIANALELHLSCTNPSRCLIIKSNLLKSIQFMDSKTFHGVPILNQGPFHSQFFAQNSNLFQINFCNDLQINSQITTDLCICHNNTFLGTYAKFCSDHPYITSIKFELRVKICLWNRSPFFMQAFYFSCHLVPRKCDSESECTFNAKHHVDWFWRCIELKIDS